MLSLGLLDVVTDQSAIKKTYLTKLETLFRNVQKYKYLRMQTLKGPDIILC